MPTDQTPDKQWKSLVTELQGEQWESLGGADEMLISRYLAGECDQQECELVEKAARSYPEVKECIELARSVLGGGPAEYVVPGETPSRKSKLRRVPRSDWSAIVRNLAIAVSLLVLVGGGTYEWVRIKSESADMLAKIGKIQENQNKITEQAGVGALVDMPKKISDLHEKNQSQQEELVDLRKQQLELQTKIQAAHKEIDNLHKRQEQVAANDTVPRTESVFRPGFDLAKPVYTGPDASPEIVLALQKSNEKLQAKIDDLEKAVVALKGSCGTCQSPSPNTSGCVACCPTYVQPSPCVPQPAPCVYPPAPYSGSCAISSQASTQVEYVVSNPIITSYSNNGGWRESRETHAVQPSRMPSTLVTNTAMPITTTVAQSSDAHHYVMRPVTPNTSLLLRTSDKSAVVTTSLYSTANQRAYSGTYTVAKPTMQTVYLAPSESFTSASGNETVPQNAGWRESRD